MPLSRPQLLRLSNLLQLSRQLSPKLTTSKKSCQMWLRKATLRLRLSLLRRRWLRPRVGKQLRPSATSEGKEGVGETKSKKVCFWQCSAD